MRDFCFLLARVVGGHLLLSTLLAEDPDHGLYVRCTQQRLVAKGTRSDPFLHTDDFPTVDAVWCGLKEGMPSRHAVTFPFRIVLGQGGICRDF